MVSAVISRPYDHAAYIKPSVHPVPSFTGAAALSQKFPTFVQKLLKSVTILPTTVGTSADVHQLRAITTTPIALVSNAGSALVTFPGGTSTVTLTNLGTIGSASAAVANFPISGGTFTATVVNVTGTTTTTSTATNAVLGSNALGGLQLSALDQYWLIKGTDATMVETAEFEYTLQPGTNFTL